VAPVTRFRGIVADTGALFSFGLPHELPDEAARRAIGEMMRVGRFEGHVAIFDGVRPDEGSRPLAALIRRLDGPHTRTERELRRLFDGRPTWHFVRVTYAVTGLEGLWCVYVFAFHGAYLEVCATPPEVCLRRRERRSAVTPT
jgi:hypothetical protein